MADRMAQAGASRGETGGGDLPIDDASVGGDRVDGVSVGRTSRIERWRKVLALGAVVLGLIVGGGMVMLSVTTVQSNSGWSGLIRGLPGAHAPGSMAVGSPNARVQIVIYFDYQCSHCEATHREVEGELIRRYVATGKARLEARPHAILGIESTRAAEATLYAADQGRFWEYRDALFAAWVRDGRYAYSDEQLIKIAGEIGLNEADLGAKLSSGAHRAAVEELVQRGRAAGVEVVPTSTVNGRVLRGQKTLEQYVQVIEEELAK